MFGIAARVGSAKIRCNVIQQTIGIVRGVVTRLSGCESISCISWWEIIFVVVGKHDYAQADLLEVAGAIDDVGLLLGLGERRQQHGRQDGDDGDDHQKFNQGEPASMFRFQRF